MALTDEQIRQMQSALNPSIQLALPQTVIPVTKTSSETRGVRYDPAKLQALKMALGAGRGDLQPLKAAITAPRPVMSNGEAIARALAQYPEARSFTGGFGEEIINPWAVGISSLARGFGNVYGARAESQREADAQVRDDAIKAAELDYKAAEMAREDAIKAAQLENEAAKQEYVNQVADDWIKYNNPTTGTGDVSYRFEPERVQELKDLNEKAGRWATEWGAGVSDMSNTEKSQAWAEFDGKTKQYVQDQLKKIYGSQMTEQDSIRFFNSMGLSRYMDPKVRWSLVENSLEDLARKNGKTLKQEPQTEIDAATAFMKGTI